MKGFDSFGVMLDMSRNGVMTVAALKKFVSIISKIGYDSLGLYTEDTFEVEGEEMFGYMRGAYTQAEIKEICNYAEGKGVTVYPCIQTLAHLNGIFRYSEYLKINDNTDILMIGDERTYKLIDNMFRTIKKTYNTDRVNIGMDEAHLVGLGRYLDKNGYKNRTELLIGHLKKVCEIADRYGLNPEMWSDMFFRLASGGRYYQKIEDEKAKEIKKIIPKNVRLVYWDYYGKDGRKYDMMLDSHKSLTDNVGFAGGAWAWSGLVPHNTFSMETIKASLPQTIKHGVKNYSITVWGDDGKECSYFAVLPSLMFAAEYAKGNKDLKSIKEKFKEITGATFDDFMKLDIDLIFGDKKSAVGVENPSKIALYNDAFLGTYENRVTAGGAEKYKKFARSIKAAEKRAGEFHYIFRKTAALSKVLSIKYDLSIRTEKIYKSGDKTALTELIKDYKKMLGYLKVFYAAIKDEWDKECKPFGFEVQDVRIGGLIKRTEHQIEKLQNYLGGKSDKIDELEAERKAEKVERPWAFNSWAYIVSPSVMSHCMIMPLL
ncbi:MAG: beta-N-acetylhexosaminidase [Clostridia bacterium]|nr:beta-N-acetylhexosaminidase [Clostridia bacterium]